jgi:hypothetical protein
MKISKLFLIILLFNVNALLAQSWNPVGSGDGINGTVYSVCAFDSVLYAGGSNFDSAGGIYIANKYIAQFNGTTWSPIPSSPVFTADINAMLVYEGKLYVAGTATSTYILVWDGKTWTWPIAAPGVVLCFTIYNGNLVFGCGDGAIESWNGKTLTQLGSTLGNTVNALTVYNGNLIAGGGGNLVGSASTSVVQWDSSSGLWKAIGSSGYPNGTIAALCTYNGVLYASYTGELFQWSGSAWTYTSTGSGVIETMGIYNGNLIAGGSFLAIGSYTTFRAAQDNGSTWSSLGSNTLNNNGPSSFTIFNGRLYSSGNFTSASGNTHVRGIAELTTSVTGIDDMSETDRIKIYPNPNHGIFNMVLNNNTSRSIVKVYNMTGQEIFNSALSAGNNNIILTGQLAGIYFYRIISGDGESQGSGKFVIE